MEPLKLNHIYRGCSLRNLLLLPSKSINCCITSPPYWGLRDYGVEPSEWPEVTYRMNEFTPPITIPAMTCCLGMEKDPVAYIGHLVLIFREVNRVLTNDGTLWLNLGDSYAHKSKKRTSEQAARKSNLRGGKASQIACKDQPSKMAGGLKQKDLVGIPWMAAFALRADGWYLRTDVVWAKKNCMPESVTDRPTRSHEFIFLLSKSSRYYYDHKAIKEPAIYDVDGTGTAARKARQHENNKLLPTEKHNGIRSAGFKDATKNEGKHSDKQRGHSRRDAGFNDHWDKMTKEEQCVGMRNKRDVWNIATAQYHEAHFAVFPDEIPSICIKAGCPPDGVVLDPFGGAGTTAVIAMGLTRSFVMIEMSPKYADMAHQRISEEHGFFYTGIEQ